MTHRPPKTKTFVSQPTLPEIAATSAMVRTLGSTARLMPKERTRKSVYSALLAAA
jgi:hypothetical protein